MIYSEARQIAQAEAADTVERYHSLKRQREIFRIAFEASMNNLADIINKSDLHELSAKCAIGELYADTFENIDYEFIQALESLKDEMTQEQRDSL